MTNEFTPMKDTIWWQVFALGACGAPIRDYDREAENTRHEERLLRLVPWLDYVIELGANGLLLTPVFSSLTHGYDTIDHFTVDSRLGNNATLEKLIEECGKRGIHIMLDGVFNHISRNHPQVEEWGLRNPDGSFHTWEGHDDLVTLNHSSPDVENFVVQVMEFWLERGITGWRLDVAYAVRTDFWQRVTSRVRRRFPRCIFLGEVIHGDYPQFVKDSHVDTVTQYELAHSIYHSLLTDNMWELDWNLTRHNDFLSTFIPNTFIGNHDVERIATAVGNAKAIAAAAVLFTVPGMPSIYYGDEQGFHGRKLEGFHADDEIRPALPHTPAELSDLGQEFHLVYRQLISLRRRHPWIADGNVETIAKENEWIHYRVNNTDGSHSHSLDVRIALTPKISVEIAEKENTIFSWEAEPAA